MHARETDYPPAAIKSDPKDSKHLGYELRKTVITVIVSALVTVLTTVPATIFVTQFVTEHAKSAAARSNEIKRATSAVKNELASKESLFYPEVEISNPGPRTAVGAKISVRPFICGIRLERRETRTIPEGIEFQEVRKAAACEEHIIDIPRLRPGEKIVISYAARSTEYIPTATPIQLLKVDLQESTYKDPFARRFLSPAAKPLVVFAPAGEAVVWAHEYGHPGDLQGGTRTTSHGEEQGHVAFVMNVDDELSLISKTGRDGLNYMWIIRPTTSQMGCSQEDSECIRDGKPAHSVSIGKGFWLGQTDVTHAAYRRVMLSPLVWYSNVATSLAGGYVPNGPDFIRHVNDYNTTGAFLGSQPVNPIPAAGSLTTSYSYDATGNLLSITSAAHDNAHLMTGISDMYGQCTWYGDLSFDARGRLIEQNTDGTGQATGYTYDANGNCLITDPAKVVTATAYDALDRTISITDPNSSATTYLYDGLGDVNQRMSPDTGTQKPNATGAITRYSYDALGRVLTATPPADAAGNPAQTTDATGAIATSTYDAAGNLAYSYDLIRTNGTGQVTYTYDANGNVMTITDPLGHVTQQAFDVLNRQMAGPDKGITTMQLSNPGSAPMTIMSISISIAGANAADFARTNNCPNASLAANVNCFISVSFTPKALCTCSALLTVTEKSAIEPLSVRVIKDGGAKIQIKSRAMGPTNSAAPLARSPVDHDGLKVSIQQDGGARLRVTSTIRQ